MSRNFVYVQNLSADELAVLLSTVNLDNQAPTAPQSQEGNTIPGHSPNLGLIPEESLNQSAAGMSGQGLLADCPLPFQDAAGGGPPKTPARGRRIAGKKAVTADDSDHEAMVSKECLSKFNHLFCEQNRATLCILQCQPAEGNYPTTTVQHHFV